MSHTHRSSISFSNKQDLDLKYIVRPNRRSLSPNDNNLNQKKYIYMIVRRKRVRCTQHPVASSASGCPYRTWPPRRGLVERRRRLVGSQCRRTCRDVAGASAPVCARRRSWKPPERATRQQRLMTVQCKYASSSSSSSSSRRRGREDPRTHDDWLLVW